MYLAKYDVIIKETLKKKRMIIKKVRLAGLIVYERAFCLLIFMREFPISSSDQCHALFSCLADPAHTECSTRSQMSFVIDEAT